MFGTQLLFTTQDSASGFARLYVTDGTASGTRMLSNVAGSSAEFNYIVVGSKFYFLGGVSADPSAGWQFYASDGTTAGTHTVNNPYGNTLGVDANSNPSVVGGHVLFGASGAVWSIDTATDAISALQTPANMPIRLRVYHFADMNGYALFVGSDSAAGYDQLFRTDGTPAGTSAIIQIRNVTSQLGSSFLEKAGNRVVFLGQDASYGLQLWSSDGTAANTVRLTNIPQPSAGLPSIGPVTVANGIFHFMVGKQGESSLTVWSSDGTPGGTGPVAGLPEADVLLYGLATRIVGDANGVYIVLSYIENQNLVHSMALYRYDAVTRSAVLVKDGLDVETNDALGIYYNSGRLYFSNNDPQTGRELWTSDGTASGTRAVANLVADTADKGSSPDEFVDFGGRLAFTADDGVSGREVWLSDGTPSGTKLVAGTTSGSASSNPSHLFVANDDLYFLTADAVGSSMLMRVGAGQTVAQPLAALTLGRYSTNRSVTYGGKAYFGASNGSMAMQLWTTDGTAAGTKPAFSAGPYNVCEVILFNNKMYFAASTNPDGTDMELWASDGTSAGTAPVLDIYPGPLSSSPNSFQVANGTLYFIAADTQGSREWKSDGTAAGTVPVSDTAAGAPQWWVCWAR